MSRLTLGRYLDDARREAGLSIRELSKLSGVLKTTIGKLLLDQVQQPKPGHLVRIAKVLEVEPADLFALAGIPTPAQRPSVEILLRTEYDLPEAAVVEAKQQIEAIVERYQGK